MQKRKHVKRTPGSGGQKNGAEKRFQDQAVAAERRTSGSSGQKNGVEKRFQNQAFNAEKRTTKKCNREKIPGSGSQDSATHEKEKRWWTGAL
jgi:hypothetical protein